MEREKENMQMPRPRPKPADLAPHLIATKGQAERPATDAAPANEPLTFKVSADVKLRFRRYALEHGLKLNETLVRALEMLEREDA